MSLGDLKDYGNKGSNFNWQKRVLQLLKCNCSNTLIIPNYNTEEINALTPSAGQLVYNTDDNKVFVYINGSGWIQIV